MSEITDDLKIDLLEISQSNGINLTSESTRIKHTKNGQFDIMSNGPINISGGNGSNFDGLSVVINGGNGLENSNSSGGSIVIAGGHGTGNAESGQINITAGSNLNGIGGDIYLEAGLSKYNSSGNPGGNIIIQSGFGGETCGNIDFFSSPTNSAQSIGPGGNINFYLGPTTLGFNETSYGTSGKVNIINGAFKLAIFTNSTERNGRIPIPEKGDMCFVADKINVYDGTAWRTISFDT
jgi:hypothetical protein